MLRIWLWKFVKFCCFLSSALPSLGRPSGKTIANSRTFTDVFSTFLFTHRTKHCLLPGFCSPRKGHHVHGNNCTVRNDLWNVSHRHKGSRRSMGEQFGECLGFFGSIYTILGKWLKWADKWQVAKTYFSFIIVGHGVPCNTILHSLWMFPDCFDNCPFLARDWR